MAKKKRSEKSAVVTPQTPALGTEAPSSETDSSSRLGGATPQLFRVRDYVLLNLIFDLFCILQLILARAVLRETTGLYFFFGLLMVGFLLVSIFDYFYDRTVWPPSREGKA